jgi:secreted PhoX family phosphatase
VATAATTFFAAPALAGGRADDDRHARGHRREKASLIGFTPVPVAEGSGKMPHISADCQYERVFSWGDELYPGSVAGVGVPCEGDPSRRPTAAEQERLIGIGHDGMSFFPRRLRGNNEGMLCLNHEFGGNAHVLGKNFPQSLEDVRVSQHAHGASVVALRKMGGKWQTVDSPHARRIHANTPVRFSGPGPATRCSLPWRTGVLAARSACAAAGDNGLGGDPTSLTDTVNASTGRSPSAQNVSALRSTLLLGRLDDRPSAPSSARRMGESCLGRTHSPRARNAAWTTRTSEGCRVPSFGVCPCGAAGSIEKHSVVNGRSRACRRSNFVS